MPAPALSVVIATYNRAGFVRACLRSLRAAGVPDLDVIVADDGSTDDTAAVVAAEWPGAAYLWAANAGTPSVPRNRGLAAARGRYVTFLDSDDAWLPGAAARAVAVLDRHPELVGVFADARYGNAADGYVSWIAHVGRADFPRLPRAELEPGVATFDPRVLFRALVRRNLIFLGACVVRRDAVAAAGGFDPTYWSTEDWDLWMRLAAAHRFAYADEPMAVYTRHPGGVTNDADRMGGGFARALGNVLARCPDLPPADRRLVRARWHEELFRHAYNAYDRGDLGTARDRFAAAVRAGNRRPLTLALWAAAHLPLGARATVRRAVRAVRGG